MMSLDLFKITSSLLLVAAVVQPRRVEWDECIDKCQCTYMDGLKQANCERAGMNEIPTSLSDEIQILMFTDNNVRELGGRIFFSVGLVNLQRIKLKNCSIEEVDKHAFAELGLISHIDLSDNNIKRLDPALFYNALNLRYVLVNNNQIRRLENNLYSNLINLRTVEFNSNEISEIGNRAFFNLPKLKTLHLKGNKLVQLSPYVFRGINSNVYFDLQNNPWRCDCQLRQFVDYVKSNLLSNQTLCSEPENVQNRSWESLMSEEFVCRPQPVLNTTELPAHVNNKTSCEPGSDCKFDSEEKNRGDVKYSNKTAVEEKSMDIGKNHTEAKINCSESSTPQKNLTDVPAQNNGVHSNCYSTLGALMVICFVFLIL